MATSSPPSAWLDRFPLSVCDGRIVDRFGVRFKLAGVNWYGASDVGHCVGGLDVRNVDDICRSIRAMGFTVVRLPFSGELLRPETRIAPGCIREDLQPEALRGAKSPLQVLDEVISALRRAEVAVMLNNHTTWGTWGGQLDAGGLWFTAGVQTEKQWLEDWSFIADRYKSQPHVCVLDLRNEVRPSPHGRCGWLCPMIPCWGGGCSCDWERAASSACAHLQEAVGDGPLLVVERIVYPARSLQRYIASLSGGHFPVNKTVFAVHLYAYHGPGCFVTPEIEASLTSRLPTRCLLRLWRSCLRRAPTYGEMSTEEARRWYSQQWGFAIEQRLAPVIVSEFGVGRSPEPVPWFNDLVDYLGEVDADFTYWPLNAGPKPGTEEDETFGLLRHDWTHDLEDPRVAALRRIVQPLARIASPREKGLEEEGP